MKRRFWGTLCALLIVTIAIISISWKPDTKEKSKTVTTKTTKAFSAKEHFAQYLEDIYNTAQLNETGLDMAVFQKAVTGYFNLKATNKVPQYSSIITIVD